MSRFSKFLMISVLCMSFAAPVFAAVETTYTHEEDRVSIPWYVANNAEGKAADLGFIKDMSPHHKGALSMSKEYLADPKAQNVRLQQLAKGIIHNQTFEITVMDMIKNHQNDAKADGSMELVAEKEMAQKLVFWRAPMPGPLDRYYGDQGVSARDVQFAKVMIIHHEGALVMAQDYINGPANNGYLRRLCLDILVDQSQEIAYMHSIVDEYPGNPDDVKIDASMIHGMEGMEHMMPGHEGAKHGGGHHGHHGM